MIEDAPKCPWCGHNKHTGQVGYHRFYCGGCGREFEDVDDSTASGIGYGSPDRRMIREETAAQRKRERKAVRR